MSGAVYRHAVFAVALAAGFVVYVPPLGLTPLKLLHAAHVGLATSFAVIYLPLALVTLYVGVGHALPVYVTVFALILAQLVGVLLLGPVNLHAVFAVDPAAELNVPLVYPLGYPKLLHAGHVLPLL